MPGGPSHVMQEAAQEVSAEPDGLHDGVGTFTNRRQCRRARPADSDSLELRPAKRQRLADLAAQGQQQQISALSTAGQELSQSVKHPAPTMPQHGPTTSPCPTNEADVPQTGVMPPPLCLVHNHANAAIRSASLMAQHGTILEDSCLPDAVDAPHSDGPMQPSDRTASPSHAAHQAAGVAGPEVQGGAPARSKQRASRDLDASLAERAARHEGLAGLAALLLQQSNPRDSGHQPDGDLHAPPAKPGRESGMPSAAGEELRPAMLQPPLLGTSKVSFF